jgi:uncharacterized membrane protein
MTEDQDKTVEPAAEQAAQVEITEVSALVVEEADGIASAVAVTATADGTTIAGVVADEDGILAQGAIGVSGEYAIIVASFADMDSARHAYDNLLAAEAAGRLDIEGVLVAKADAEGKIEIVKLTDHKTRNGFLAGAVAGAVLAVIFPPSILVGALGVGIGGAAIGKVRNLATRSAVAKDLASVLTPGSSGIVALARLAQVEEVKAEIPEATAVKAAPVSDEVAEVVKEAAKESGAAPEA